jgi:Flp pilus assembly protein TadD
MNPDLQQGLRLHQRGRVAEAIGVYEPILAQALHDHDALQYLGVAYKQTGSAV